MMLILMLTIAKESSNLIGVENFGKTGFTITAGLEWCVLYQTKSDQIPTHHSPPTKFIHYYYLKLGIMPVVYIFT